MKKVLLTHSLNSFIIQPESYGATVDEGFIVGGPVGDFELLLCHGTVCVVGKIRDLILQLSKVRFIQQSRFETDVNRLCPPADSCNPGSVAERSSEKNGINKALRSRVSLNTRLMTSTVVMARSE
ncbi:hypothetical protein BANRA_05649 [Escherichia coli]|nr:hypothetical protein BANRA_05649 [Escherichia coli]